MIYLDSGKTKSNGFPKRMTRYLFGIDQVKNCKASRGIFLNVDASTAMGWGAIISRLRRTVVGSQRVMKAECGAMRKRDTMQ